MIRMTEEKCPRCSTLLASSNKHPMRLCGPCQHDLGSYTGRVTSPKLRAWIEAGKPKIVRDARARRAPAMPTPGEVPSGLVLSRDPRTWPDDHLIEAAREFFRRRNAEAVAGLIGPEPFRLGSQVEARA